MMRLHESIGEGKLRFAVRLNEISDELSQLHREVEKSRKQVGESFISTAPRFTQHRPKIMETNTKRCFKKLK